MELQRSWDTALSSLEGELRPLVDRLHWSFDRAMRSALTNIGTVSASPIWRYCVAVKYGFPDIAAAFHAKALADYVFQKTVYDAAWGDRIPQELRLEGEALRAQMLT
jgi:hypothetical protein